MPSARGSSSSLALLGRPAERFFMHRTSDPGYDVYFFMLQGTSSSMD